jgi:hypothetical protein
LPTVKSDSFLLRYDHIEHFCSKLPTIIEYVKEIYGGVPALFNGTHPAKAGEEK